MAGKSKLVALNAALAAGLALIIWQGAEVWKDAKAQRKATVNVPVRTTPSRLTTLKPGSVKVTV